MVDYLKIPNPMKICEYTDYNREVLVGPTYTMEEKFLSAMHYYSKQFITITFLYDNEVWVRELFSYMNKIYEDIEDYLNEYNYADIGRAYAIAYLQELTSQKRTLGAIINLR